MGFRVRDKRNRDKRVGGRGTPWDSFHGSVPHDAMSWVNQGGATAVQKDNRAVLLTAPAAVNDNWRGRALTLPTPPYTLITAFFPMLAPSTAGTEAPAVAVGWRESGTGELALLRIYYDNGTYYTLVADYSHWTSPTIFSAVAAGPVYGDWLQHGSAVWVQLHDNNTNRVISVSPDGLDWFAWTSEGRTNFLTADQAVFLCNADNANYPAVMKVMDFHFE